MAGSKLIVVLGHRSCSAIKGACDGVELGNPTQMLGKLKPAIDAVRDPTDPAQRTSANKEFVQHVALANVRHAVDAILAGSEVLCEMCDAGEIDVIGTMYDVESGAVERLA